MPETFTKPWRLREFLEANALEHSLSLPWQFRLELLERVAKLTSDLHHKNRAYGFGALSDAAVYISASDRYGLEALKDYPTISSQKDDLEKLDVLCLGVLLLEVVLEKPIIGKEVPQLVALLRRKGLGNQKIVAEVVKGKFMQKALLPISKIKDTELLNQLEPEKRKVQTQYVLKELIKEELHRTDYNDEEAEPVNAISNDSMKNNVTKGANGNGGVILGLMKEERKSVRSVRSNSTATSSASQSLKVFMTAAKSRITKFLQSTKRNTRSTSAPPAQADKNEGKKLNARESSRNLVQEKKNADSIIEQALNSETKALESLTKGKHNVKFDQQDEYVMADIIKQELKNYLKKYLSLSLVNNLEKPSWLISMESLIINLLNPVDDSRPSSRVARNMMLEILESFSKSQRKHEEVKRVIREDPEFLELSEEKKQETISFSETMKRGNYFQHVYLYDLFYKNKPIENLLEDVETVKIDIIIYKAEDVRGDPPPEEDDDISVAPDFPDFEDFEELKHDPTTSKVQAKQKSDLKKLLQAPAAPSVPAVHPPPSGLDSKSNPRASTKDSKIKQFMKGSATLGKGLPKKGSMEAFPSFYEKVLEDAPPPIIGPKADKMLNFMDNERTAIGSILKTKDVAKMFDNQERMPHQKVVNLLKKARDILDKQKNIIQVDAPVIIVGDIHGQYFDLRQVMKFCGKPRKKQPKPRLPVDTLNLRGNQIATENVASALDTNGVSTAGKKKIMDRISAGVRKARSSVARLTEEDKAVFNKEDFVVSIDKFKKEAEEAELEKAQRQATLSANGEGGRKHKHKTKGKTTLAAQFGSLPPNEIKPHPKLASKTLTLGKNIPDGFGFGAASFADSSNIDGAGNEDKDDQEESDPTRKTSSRLRREEDQKGKTFLFLGDYVDRGNWSCEVLFYLLTLLVEYPDSVLMLRGNHECDAMAETYGFREECEHKYGREIYHRCVQVFNAFPIACIVNLPNNKRFLACHGGLSDQVTSLEQIAKLERRREPGIEGVLCDLLWSDPVPNDVVEMNNLPMQFKDIEYISNETRGCAKKFGYKALEKFLQENNLVGIIRAHEAKEEGFQFHFQNAGTKNHLCVTVFSAPNYMNDHGNKGAVVILHKTVKDRLIHQMRRLKYKYSVDQVLRQQDKQKDDYLDLLEPICYHEVHQPDVVTFDHENWNMVKQVEETCPYMPTNIDEFYNSSLDILDRYGDAKQQLADYKKEQELKAAEAKKDLEATKEEEAKLRSKKHSASENFFSSVKVRQSVRGAALNRTSNSHIRSPRAGQPLVAGSASLRSQMTLKKMTTLKRQSTANESAGNLVRQTTSIKDFQHQQFSRSMKRTIESHPQIIQEKFRLAESKLERMEEDALSVAKLGASSSFLYEEDIIKPKTGILSPDNIATMKRSRAVSQGASAQDTQTLRNSVRNNAPIAVNRVMGTLQAQGRGESISSMAEAEDDNRAVIEQISTRSFMKRERVEIDYKDSWRLMIASWLSDVAGVRIEVDELFHYLEDCSLLCKAAAIVIDNPEMKYYKPKVNSELSAFEIRRNLIVFQDVCRQLGIHYMFVILDIKNEEVNYVLPALIEIAKVAKAKDRLKLGYEVLPKDFPPRLWNEELNSEIAPLQRLTTQGQNGSTTLQGEEEWRTKGLEVGNVNFNGGERLMLQLLFHMIDRDDSGFLTIEAIITWAKEEGKFIRKAHAEKVISAIDYDNDGMIGLRDFFQYAAKLKEEFENDEYEEEEEDYESGAEPGEGDKVLFEKQMQAAEQNGLLAPMVESGETNLVEVNLDEDDSGSEESSEYPPVAPAPPG